MRISTCLLPKAFSLALVALVAIAVAATPLAAQVVNAGGVDAAPSGEGVVPVSYQGSGSFYNQQLGTIFRLNYHTQSYGVDEGVLSLGGMKVIGEGNSNWFIDGQGTLSEAFGGGFNFGVGHRTLANMGFGPDPERIHGLGFWVDGQSTDADNFFTQLGFSLESLGDSFDMRLNGSFPLDRTMVGDPVLTSTSELTYIANSLFSGTETVVTDTAHDVVDAELAKRISDLDAWAFIGGYHLGGGGLSTEGVRFGVRGYAVPDLALSLQVTDDDLFDTNVVFGLTWFVGRTHRGNLPCGTLADRFREPVLRNDYIATTSRSFSRASGSALTDSETNELLRIVHVDSSAAVGGDGTFENPYSRIDAVNGAGSLEDDKILVHGGSVFANQTITLQTGQDLFGEGRDPNLVGDPVAVTHAVNTVERGLLNLPETAIGAALLATPTINAGAGADVFTMANNSTINNFIVNGGARAVVASGITAPSASMLANLDLNNQTGDSIFLSNISGALIVDNSVLIEGAAGAAINVDGGLDGMTLNAGIVNSAGSALTIQNRTGGTLVYGGTIDDDGGEGITIDGNTDSTINLTNGSTEVTNGIDINTASEAIAVTDNSDSTINFTGTVGVTGTGANRAVNIASNNVGTTIDFDDLDATALNGNTVEVNEGGTVNIDSAGTRMLANTGTGNAFDNTGNPTDDDNATITIGSNIDNSGGGRAVRIVSRAANNVALNGTVDETGDGILVQNNSGGFIAFNGQTTATVTGGNTAIDINGNTADVTIGFIGVDVTSDSGTGFRAVGAGDLSVAGTNNSITTQSGVALDVQGMNIIASNLAFSEIDVTAGTGNAINLQNVEGGGQIVLGGGTNGGDGGTLVTAGTAINVDNVNSLLVTNIDIDNTAATGIDISNQTAGSTATFTGLDVTTTTATAVAVDDNTNGTITFNSLRATNSGAADVIVVEDNANGNVTFNTLTASATGAGDAVVIQNNTAGTYAIAGGNIDTTTGDGVTVTNNGAATTNLGNLDIDTTTGTGLIVNGTGTLNTTGTNTIDTTGGVGIDITNAETATLNGVTINAGGSNAVNVTHTSADTSDVTLSNVTVASAGGRGFNALANGSGEFDLTITNSNISGVGQEGIVFDTGANANRVDFTLTDSVIVVGDTTGLLATLNDSNVADVRFVIDDNQITNNSGAADTNSAAVDISVSSGLILHARIGNLLATEDAPPAPLGDSNRFVNSSVNGDPLRIAVSAGTLNLDLRDNTAQGGSVAYVLDQTGGTFNLVDSADTIADLNNVGDVNTTGTINTIAPPVLAPTP